MADPTSALALNRARTIHELTLQQSVTVQDGDKTLGSVFAAEFLDEKQWEAMRAARPLLLISNVRAALLGFKGVVALEVADLSLAQLFALIAGDAAALSFKAKQAGAPAIASELIILAKQGGLLPALLWFAGAGDAAHSAEVEALHYRAPAEMLRAETVSLPIDGAENTTLTSFRTRCGAGVHLALVIGKIDPQKPPLVRVHSSCVTGDLLGSMRCDCGGQLQLALSKMKEETSGILLYLYQEGRDIGITSKLRAYALQERGLDTFAANQQLGFEEDERDFSIAGAILKSLGVAQIRLLTNNPDKIANFDNSGIRVVERVPLITGDNAHNHHYIDAKKKKRGHLY